MFELFTTFESFSVYIVFLTILAVLSILFESKLVALEDRIRDYFAELFGNNKAHGKKKKQNSNNKSKIAVTDKKEKSNHFAA